jgi:maleate cis-trans isomerase
MDLELANEIKNSKLDKKIYYCAIAMVNYIDNRCLEAIASKKNYKETINPCYLRLDAIESIGMKRYSCFMPNLVKITTKMVDLLRRKGYVVDDSDILKVIKKINLILECEETTGIKDDSIQANHFVNMHPFDIHIEMKVY